MTGEETQSTRQLCLRNKKMKPKKSMVKYLNSKKDIRKLSSQKKAAAEKRKEAHDTRIDKKKKKPQQLQEQKALLLKTKNKSLKVKA